MWEEMAELSVKHLKPNDFIYVSGRLGSYTKVDQNGNLSIRYKVRTLPPALFNIFFFIPVPQIWSMNIDFRRS